MSDSPRWLLNVPRRADRETIEAAFAREYKAARRAADAERLRPALNAALATLLDPSAAARADAVGWQLPLDPAGRLPELADALAELLPLAPPADLDSRQPLLETSAEALVEAWLTTRPPRDWPAERLLLHRLAARLAVDDLDPWETP